MEFLQVAGPILSNSVRLAVSLAQSNYQLLQGMNGDIRKLSSRLTTIQYVIQDAEEKQLDDLHIRDWLRKIKETACDAEDILKSLETEACLWQRNKQAGNTFKAPISEKHIAFKLKGADELKDVLARLDEIADEKKFHLTVNLNVKRDTYGGRHTVPFVVETDVLGREDDRDKIIERLLSDEEDVVAVVGMGGLGKTTLAQLVYNNDRVQGHFEFKMWVCVTNNYDYRRVIKEMIEYRSKMKYDITTLSDSQLVDRLLDLISEKKFFLVLDDVWIESRNKWKNLEDLLKQGAKGSRIMITTRSTKVATVSSSGKPYCLDFLSEEKCWLLFERNAFRQHDEIDENLRRELEIIGREIVNNCNRLPLAIKALGSALHGETNVKIWQRILKHNFWKAEEQSGSSDESLCAEVSTEKTRFQGSKRDCQF